MRIPLVDLQWQHEVVAREIRTEWEKVIDGTAFVGGSEVEAFERAFAAHEGAAACVGVANGTDALELALRAAGGGPGHEVVVPAYSFVASAEAMTRIGARPAFVDVDADHLLLDPDRVAHRIDAGVRALMPVHLFGQMAPMEDLLALAGEAGIPVIEDAAQAQGARQWGRAPGSLGVAAGTSFYPSKNLGAYGDAGADVHYPLPPPFLPAFRPLDHGKDEFPVAARAAEAALSLPLDPGIRKEQQERVADALRKALR